ncbi:T9SS type A sorting domain-containing protein [Ferruginibacter lapsinanis]|uniref:T9SS type A sorting domain-containing protein n=1 Tax=Ferruginibacter lapsinanis TaxID=563172 RepID=UPI001E62DD48|nr:T9SS type A sorting domain-containing protein [Ferruginibacter lapsinanis]UEG49908.1 T9SS type A sorting domain-containing protein [Ferruginibacter lapsinanis]
MKSFLTVLAIALTLPSFCQYNFYFGNLHAHTAYSDGNKDSATTGYKTPGSSFSYAKGSYHMDFLGIAEHNHFSSTNNPGMHVADYTKGAYQADTANQEGSFVCMFGMEWGVIDNGGHIITYGVPGWIGWESGSGSWGPSNNYTIYCAKNDYSNFWKIINSYPTAFCTLAHPQDFDYNNLIEGTYNPSADSAIVGVAVRSGAAFSTTTDYSDPAPSSYQSVYFNALAKGYHLGPNCDQDNHYTNFGRTNHIRTVVLAKNLKRDSITAAYKANRFYATDDWNAQVNFTVNGSFMGSNITSATNSDIQVSVADADAGDDVSRIDIYYGIPGSGSLPTILRTVTSSNTLSYTHSTVLNDKFYYFARIIQKDGDFIYTAPIWVFRNLSSVPLTLINFTAIEKEKKVLLNWTTAQEINDNKIDIEHAVDGIHFTVIGSIQSANTNQPNNYSFIDSIPANGINFYRLKQTAVTGNVVYSSITAITISKPTVEITKINPNPVINQLNIICNAADQENIICKIYSAEGREVKNIAGSLVSGENKITVDVSSLRRGTYFIVISKPDEKITEAKFIKQ